MSRSPDIGTLVADSPSQPRTIPHSTLAAINNARALAKHRVTIFSTHNAFFLFSKIAFSDSNEGRRHVAARMPLRNADKYHERIERLDSRKGNDHAARAGVYLPNCARADVRRRLATLHPAQQAE